MSRLHRGNGCPFCGKAASHNPRVRRTSPGGHFARIVTCTIKGGGNYTWKANGTSVSIPAFISSGVFTEVEASGRNDHAKALAFANSLPRRKKKRRARG